MNAKQRIVKAARPVLGQGGVYKGRGFNGYGWYHEKFGKVPEFLGKNEAEALKRIEQLEEVQE